MANIKPPRELISQWLDEVYAPAAQAVVDAVVDVAPAYADIAAPMAAAALRAAADQVVPSDAVEPRNYLPMAIECQRIRAELLAIAAELEGADD